MNFTTEQVAAGFAADAQVAAARSERSRAQTEELVTNIAALRAFIGVSQLQAIGHGLRSEERQFFIEKLEELAQQVTTMPKTYEQDGKGDNAIVTLHYFKDGADWYITERDMERAQLQAFGLADLFGDGGELGYINIVELIRNGVELDMYFTPCTLESIRKECA
jgi:hypothetical protein